MPPSPMDVGRTVVARMFCSRRAFRCGFEQRQFALRAQGVDAPSSHTGVARGPLPPMGSAKSASTNGSSARAGAHVVGRHDLVAAALLMVKGQAIGHGERRIAAAHGCFRAGGVPRRPTGSEWLLSYGQPPVRGIRPIGGPGGRLQCGWRFDRCGGTRPGVGSGAGGGYASFTVANGLAFTIEQRRGQRGRGATTCAPARSAGPIVEGLFAEPMGGNGPRATPVWDDGRIYALGAEGELRCLEAHRKLVWNRTFSPTTVRPTSIGGWRHAAGGRGKVI